MDLLSISNMGAKDNYVSKENSGPPGMSTFVSMYVTGC